MDIRDKEKVLERLDRAISDIIDNPDKPQQTISIETLF